MSVAETRDTTLSFFKLILEFVWQICAFPGAHFLVENCIIWAWKSTSPLLS